MTDMITEHCVKLKGGPEIGRVDCPLVVALLGCSLAVMEKPRRKPHSHIGDTLSKSPVMLSYGFCMYHAWIRLYFGVFAAFCGYQ